MFLDDYKKVRKNLKSIKKAEEGDTKMIFGKPYEFKSGEWVQTGAGAETDDAPDKISPEDMTVKNNPYGITMKDVYEEIQNDIEGYKESYVNEIMEKEGYDEDEAYNEVIDMTAEELAQVFESEVVNYIAEEIDETAGEESPTKTKEEFKKGDTEILNGKEYIYDGDGDWWHRDEEGNSHVKGIDSFLNEKFGVEFPTEETKKPTKKTTFTNDQINEFKETMFQDQSTINELQSNLIENDAFIGNYINNAMEIYDDEGIEYDDEGLEEFAKELASEDLANKNNNELLEDIKTFRPDIIESFFEQQEGGLDKSIKKSYNQLRKNLAGVHDMTLNYGTTTTEDMHSHAYKMDVDGNGTTTGMVGVHGVPHTHEIKNFDVNNVQGHTHELIGQ